MENYRNKYVRCLQGSRWDWTSLILLYQKYEIMVKFQNMDYRKSQFDFELTICEVLFAIPVHSVPDVETLNFLKMVF